MAENDKCWGTSWVVVTGASRGLGAAICEAVAPLMGPGSTLLALARSEEGLNQTKAKVKDINENLKFISVTVDLGTTNKEELQRIFKEAFHPAQSTPLSRALIFHNAGSLQHLVYMREMKDIAKINSYFQLNLSSTIVLNAVFLEALSSFPTVPITVVNISSLCAIEAFKSWALYCSAKAARDIAFKVLAAEEPKIRVLSYAPGPLDNEMGAITRTETKDEELKSMFNSMKDKGKLLSCSQSTSKLLMLLDKDEFKSGAHIDYYDV